MYTCIYMSGRARIGFEWDEGNEGHIAAHGITPAEVEEALTNEDWLLMLGITTHPSGENRYICYGKTDDGKPLRVVFTMRRGKTRPVTAHKLKRKMRSDYEKAIEKRRNEA